MNRRSMSKRLLSLVIIATMISPNIVNAKEIINKEQSVYVILDQKGDVKKEIISNWIHTDNPTGEIIDKSTLDNIKNLKGDEEPIEQDGKLIWKTNKNDIFYQGTTDKKLPLDVKIKYFFEGKECESSDIVGKSGKIKIRIDYKNKDKHIEEINGKQREVYTPFTVATLVNLPLDNFKNVKVNSGELIQDGNNQMITFLCFPGIKDSLSINKELNDKLDLPEYLEITADTEEFELDSIMITATPSLPKVDELENADDLDELIDGLEELNDASDKLTEGAFKLSDGTKEFSDKMNELVDAVKELSDGTKELNDGVIELKDGVITLEDKINTEELDEEGNPTGLREGYKKLFDGITELNDGINKKDKDENGNPTGLREGMQALVDGAKEMDEKINSDEKDEDGDPTSLIGGINALYDGVIELDDKVNNSELDEDEKPKGLVCAVAMVVGGIGNLSSAITNSKSDSDGKPLGLQRAASMVKSGLEELYNKVKNVLLSGVEKLEQAINTTARDENGKPLGLREGMNDLKKATLGIKTIFNDMLLNEKGEPEFREDGKTPLPGLKDISKEIASGAHVVNSGVNELVIGSKNNMENIGQSVNEALINLNTYIKMQGIDTTTGSAIQLGELQNELYKIAGVLQQSNNEENQIKIKSLIQGVDNLDKGAQGLNMAIQKVAKGTEALDQNVGSLQMGVHALGDEVKNKLLPGVEQSVYGIKQLSDGASGVSYGIGKLAAGASELSAAGSQVLKATNELGDAVHDDLLDGITKVKDGANELGDAVHNDMIDSIDKLNDGVIELADGVEKDLVPGAEELKDGIDELGDKVRNDLLSGVNDLYDGTEKLNDAVANDLVEGVNKALDASIEISDGSEELADNMDKFDKEGIDKMHLEMDDNVGSIEDLVDIKDKLIELSEEYKAFTSIDDNMEGKVKFVMKTEEVKINQGEEIDIEEEVEDKKGLMKWIKSLFN